MTQGPTIDGEWTFSFRLLTRADFPLLAGWLAAPHVARWWNHEHTPAAVERDFGPGVDGAEPGEDWLVELHEGPAPPAPLGLMQFGRYADYPAELRALESVMTVPEGATSIDYLIGDPARTGMGLGPAMIGAFVERIWQREPGARCIVVPVVAANRASWRALERAGFRRVAQGDLEPDNPVDEPLHVILQLDRPVSAR